MPSPGRITALGRPGRSVDSRRQRRRSRYGRPDFLRSADFEAVGLGRRPTAGHCTNEAGTRRVPRRGHSDNRPIFSMDAGAAGVRGGEIPHRLSGRALAAAPRRAVRESSARTKGNCGRRRGAAHIRRGGEAPGDVALPPHADVADVTESGRPPAGRGWMEAAGSTRGSARVTFEVEAGGRKRVVEVTVAVSRVPGGGRRARIRRGRRAEWATSGRCWWIRLRAGSVVARTSAPGSELRGDDRRPERGRDRRLREPQGRAGQAFTAYRRSDVAAAAHPRSTRHGRGAEAVRCVNIIAPMPGRIVKVLVNEGDARCCAAGSRQ